MRRTSVFLAACLVTVPASGADWPCWRGPTHDGLSSESVPSWPPERLWDADVGAGCTSPILADGCLYTVGFSGDHKGKGTDTVWCFDAASGRVLWKQTSPSRYQSRLATGGRGAYGGPTATPSFDPRGLAFLALQDVVVLRIDRGHEGRTVATLPWQTDFANNLPTPVVAGNRLVVTSDYNVSRSALLEVGPRRVREVWKVKDHSKVTSPVIHEGRVYLADSAVTCLDLASGRRLWQRGKVKHGSCLVATGNGRFLVFGSGDLSLYDLVDGREVGRVEKVVRGTCYPHVALSDGLLACKDRDGRLVLLRVKS